MLLRWLFASALLTCTAAASWCEEPAAPNGPQVIENSIGMKLVLVPAGEFLMGSDVSPAEMSKTFPQYGKDRYGQQRLELADERPLHKVRITKPFYFGQCEVTVGQFRQFVDSGYRPESIADGTGGYGYDPQRQVLPDQGEAFAGRDPKYSWSNPGFPQGDNHPVTNVTWNDAQAMCQWLSAREGKKYRLPTEAEWEYACRAGTTTFFSSGNDPESLVKVANSYDADTLKNWPQWKEFAIHGHDGYEFTAPVGSFAPNALGLYDMHGNVWEWCADWYGEDYYARSPVDDPPGPEDGNVHVRRGGSWHTWPLYLRSSYRNWMTARTRYTLLGMRLVREP
jgi:formylglycine-generating enzyme